MWTKLSSQKPWAAGFTSWSKPRRRWWTCRCSTNIGLSCTECSQSPRPSSCWSGNLTSENVCSTVYTSINKHLNLLHLQHSYMIDSVIKLIMVKLIFILHRSDQRFTIFVCRGFYSLHWYSIFSGQKGTMVDHMCLGDFVFLHCYYISNIYANHYPMIPPKLKGKREKVWLITIPMSRPDIPFEVHKISCSK